jgi:hypothetical protein
MSVAYPWSSPTPSKRDVRAALLDFDRYRETFLRVRPFKGGDRISFILNAPQCVLDAKIQDERKTFGMVRALVPKARQMGVSKYVGARYFHRTATEFGRRAQIVAHRSDSAANLHRDIKEFYDDLPQSARPHLGASNARELIFDKLKSLYKVASAEGGDIGRSDDFHLLHLSEAAFFDNTEDLSSGLLQTVKYVSNTEIIMESTGNGQSGMFYNMCQEAHASQNKGPWRLHFLPWPLMPEYRMEVPSNWKAPKDFEDYAKFHGLEREQIHWFWMQNYTIALMNGGQSDKIHRLTRQEYPATYDECFMADSTLDFFAASVVNAAMLRKPAPSAGALKLLCVDPAGDGQDKPFVCDRQGSAIGARVWGELSNRDFNVQADWLAQTYERFGMDAIVIDATGIGKGLVDAVRLRMRRQGAEKVVAVNFAWGALNDTLYGNRRAELHDKFQRWLQSDVSMPNDKLLSEEAAAYKWGTGGCRRDEKMRLFMTPKASIHKDIGRSPDRLDTCAVSMAIEG